MYQPYRDGRDDTMLASDCKSQQSRIAWSLGCQSQYQRHQSVVTQERVSARLSALLFAVAVAAELMGTSRPASAQTGTQASAPGNAAASFEGQAAQLGIKSCAAVFAGLGNSLSDGAAYASSAQTHKTAPNDHAAQAVVGMKYDTPGYQAQAAGIVFAAPTASGCEGQVVRVAPFPQSCPDVVARQLPKGSILATTLSGTPLYTLGGKQGQALLVPSGNSCVVVTVASAMERR